MKRSCLYCVLVFVVAAGVWFFLQSSSHLLFPHLDVSTVARIEYEHLVGGMQLKRTPDGWQVAPFVPQHHQTQTVEWKKADEQRVQRALSTFAELQQGVLVSSNPNNQHLYRVDALGEKVRFFDAQEKNLVNLIIGKAGPDVVSQFIRRDESNDVYLIAEPLTGIFSLNADDWVPKHASTHEGANTSQGP